jgi:hypothetical protein
VPPPPELKSSTAPIVIVTPFDGMPQSESKSFISVGVAPLICMYCAIIVKLLSGAALKAAISAGVVFFIGHKHCFGRGKRRYQGRAFGYPRVVDQFVVCANGKGRQQDDDRDNDDQLGDREAALRQVTWCTLS